MIPNPVELSNTFSQIAKQVEPSVVNISTTYNAQSPRRLRETSTDAGGRPLPTTEDQDDNGGGMDEFLYRFFGGNPFGGGGIPRWASAAARRSVRAWWWIRPATS